MTPTDKVCYISNPFNLSFHSTRTPSVLHLLRQTLQLPVDTTSGYSSDRSCWAAVDECIFKCLNCVCRLRGWAFRVCSTHSALCTHTPRGCDKIALLGIYRLFYHIHSAVPEIAVGLLYFLLPKPFWSLEYVSRLYVSRCLTLWIPQISPKHIFFAQPNQMLVACSLLLNCSVVCYSENWKDLNSLLIVFREKFRKRPEPISHTGMMTQWWVLSGVIQLCVTEYVFMLRRVWEFVCTSTAGKLPCAYV